MDGADAAPPDRGGEWIPVDEVARFVEEVLFAPDRTLPVVAVTTTPHGDLRLDLDRLVRELGDDAKVVGFVTGEPTWALSEALPPRLDVFGGAARIWWPGLRRSSIVFDHPLLFVRVGEEDAVRQRIVTAIRSFWNRGPAAPPGAVATARGRASRDDGPALTKSGKPILTATVTELRGGRVFLRAGDHHGYLGYADERLPNLATRWQVGDAVRVFVAAEAAEGVVFSIQGLTTSTPGPSVEGGDAGDGLEEPVGPAPARSARPTPGPRPDPWQVIAEAYQVGDIVRGEVCLVRERFALIELLPGAAAICPIAELADRFVTHAEEVVERGERVHVEILALEPEARRSTVSIRRAGWAEPLPAISPGPGLPPFLADPDPGADRRGDDLADLKAELAAANVDRAALRARLTEQNEQLVALRRDLRSAQDRAEALQSRYAGDLDPTVSATAFLTAVRVEYARQVSEDERWDLPLLRLRVHPDFLATVRTLDGVAVDKIIEVCAQVGCNRAHQLAGREVHVLRSSDRGPAIVRARDGATAWRCAIQIATPSARRLHWWSIPGDRDPRDPRGDGRIIEFASVGLHDDVSIPT